MDFEFRQANSHEVSEALAMLKATAKNLRSKQIDQWAFWLDPPEEKVQWIQEGFRNGEFYFIVQDRETLGMFRLSDEDRLYWGETPGVAKYLHSLVVKKEYAGHRIGKQVMDRLIEKMKTENTFLLRLDCNADNEKLCDYYEKQGFVKVREKLMPHSRNNLYEKKLN